MYKIVIVIYCYLSYWATTIVLKMTNAYIYEYIYCYLLHIPVICLRKNDKMCVCVCIHTLYTFFLININLNEFFLWNTKDVILKNISYFCKMKVNGVHWMIEKNLILNSVEEIKSCRFGMTWSSLVKMQRL